ncbi:MAG: hypothetical protein KI792_11975 [Alphaproteobacteria bacterium]|nr:hypothetical protein [Alphaproteobacteria bacterium SS10]
MAGTERIARLGRPKRIWAIPAIHGAVDRLTALHTDLADWFQAGDRIVYLGNMIGQRDESGQDTIATINELLRFRREMMAKPAIFSTDLVYLRGAQEEIWHRLLQLQFAAAPSDVLEWMLSHGAAPLVTAYGSDIHAGRNAARCGAQAITRWTNGLRQSIARHDGHRPLLSAIQRAAVTEYPHVKGLNTVLVSAGICPTTPLEEQAETLWFGGQRFDQLDAPVHGYGRIVRGWRPRRGLGEQVFQPEIGKVTACLDGGKTLNLAVIGPDGKIEIAGQYQSVAAIQEQSVGQLTA